MADEGDVVALQHARLLGASGRGRPRASSARRCVRKRRSSRWMALQCRASTGAMSRLDLLQRLVGVRAGEIEEDGRDAPELAAAQLERGDGVVEARLRRAAGDRGRPPPGARRAPTSKAGRKSSGPISAKGGAAKGVSQSFRSALPVRAGRAGIVICLLLHLGSRAQVARGFYGNSRCAPQEVVALT